MPTANVAGDLPEDQDLNGSLTIKIGNREDNPRGRRNVNDTFPFQFKIADGFAVFKARVETIAQQNNSGSPLPDEYSIYFRRAKNATQNNYVELSAENWVDHIKFRWNKITQLDMTRWQNLAEPTTAVGGTTFEMYIYKPRKRKSPVQATENATNRQAAALDRPRAELDNPAEEAAQEQENFLKRIRLEINGTMVDVRVDIRTLRSALNLPQHDVFNQGINNG